MSDKGGGLAASKVEEFLVILRTVALNSRETTSDILINALDSRAVLNPERKVKVLDVRSFIDGMSTVKEIRHKFTTADLADIFNEADESELGSLSLYEVIDFVDKTISCARTIALKLRNIVLKQFKTEADYTAAFISYCNNITKECERENFTQFAEDLLQTSISESDALALYTLFDTDENGRVSVEDFVGFISGQNTEAVSLLSTGDPEDIVDIRISQDVKMDNVLGRIGYSQVIPRLQPGSNYDLATKGSFGLGQSLWIWRRKQGTCGGRLKAIVDIQTTSKSPNTSMVINGYQNLRGSINNKRIWIKRATKLSEHQEALVDLTVTLGKPSHGYSDAIFTSPGPGWLIVGENERFATKTFSYEDAFLWMLPIRTRTTELGNVNSMQRAVATMSESKKNEKILSMAKASIRNYVPHTNMQQECCPNKFRRDSSKTSTVSQKTATAQPGYNRGTLVSNFDSKKDIMNTMVTKVIPRYDFSNTFMTYCERSGGKTLSLSAFEAMLKHAGCHIDHEKVKYVFAYFDISQKGALSREDFARMGSLNEYEIDQRIELIRLKMSNHSGSDAALDDVEDIDVATSMKIREAMSSRSQHTEIRNAKIFAQVFQIVNTDRDGILSQVEFQEMLRAMEIYMTDEESRKVLTTMDLSGNDRVEEADFVGYLKKPSEVVTKLAHRLRDEANVLRRWLQRGGTSSSSKQAGGSGISVNSQWADLEKRRRIFSPHSPSMLASLEPDDIMMVLGYLNISSTPKGARNITLMVSPDGNGKVTREELSQFMSRSTRTFGELLALMERDVMKPVYDTFIACRDAKRAGARDAEKAEAAYGSLLREVVSEINNSSGPAKASPRVTMDAGAEGSSGMQDVVSVSQLKAGVEAAVRRYKEIDGVAPNVEEWACLALLVGASVTENGVFGVRPQAFVESMCGCISLGIDHVQTTSSGPSLNSLDRLVKEFQRLVRETAIQAGNGASPDYRAAFNVINTDGDEVLSMKELQAHLARLHLSDLCPDEELPKFVRMIDQSNQGYVTFDDFMKFVETNKGVELSDARRVDESDETDPAKMSGDPPVAITKNADCDYLLWFVWRQACRIEPQDPEIIVTELENACTEAELSQREGTISVKELWNLMFELRIQTQNNISKVQFEKGIRYLVNDPRDLDPSSSRGLSSNDVQVDYRTLTRYVIRMGRAHETLVEERRASDEAKYRHLKGDLRQFLLSLDQEDHTVTGYTPRDFSGVDSRHALSGQVRFERVFKRLDSDGDGKINTAEFKIGLRRLGYKQEKAWTTSITKLLFADLDSDRDGTLSLRELTRLVRDDVDSLSPRTQTGILAKEAEQQRQESGNSANDPEDDLFGKGGKAIAESELFFKAYTILKEMVPPSVSSNFEGVKNAIRRFFLRSDVENKGWVSEERFRAFLRRSSLADKMTSGELRRMTEALVKRHIVRSPNGVPSTQNQVDYEKLITLMESASETGPTSKADIVLLKLRDAAANSAAIGRPFISLCTLVDVTNTGRITKEELVLACKMMGAIVTANDIESLKDDTLEGTFATDGSVDYKEVNYLITKEVTAGISGSAVPGHAHSHHNQAGGSALLNLGPASFSRPQAHTLALGGGAPDGDYLTPRGNLYDRLAATTPYTRDGVGAPATAVRSHSPYLSPGGHRANGNGDLSYVLDRIRTAVDDKARKWSGRSAYTGSTSESYSLLRQMTIFDASQSRSIATRDFVAIIEDLGIPLSNNEVHIIQAAYPGEGGGDTIAYEPLCGDIGGSYQAPRPATAPRETFTPAYLTSPRVLNRFADLKAEGRGPRDIFEGYDIDVTGLVEAWRFKEVLNRLHIIPPEQVKDAALDFAALGNGDNVSYDDFCRVIEVAAKDVEYSSGIAERGNTSRPFSRSSQDYYGTSGRRQNYAGAESASPLNNDNVDQWLTRGASPKQRRDFESIYDDLARFKEEQRGDRSVRGSRDRGRDKDFPLTLDEGSEFDSSTRRLRPPAVSTSRDFSYEDRERSRGRSPLGRSYEDTRRSLERDRDRDYRGESPKPPRASPSKVGSKMWGSQTSLDLKGKSVYLDEAHWTCPVCLYVENDANSDKCLICNTPNYNNQPEFQVKNQCSNCTFLNGQYAHECEMCGLPLGSSKSVF